MARRAVHRAGRDGHILMPLYVGMSNTMIVAEPSDWQLERVFNIIAVRYRFFASEGW